MEAPSLELLDEVWDDFCDLPEPEAQKLAHRMADEQPALLAYLLAMDEAIENPAVPQGTFTQLGLTIWQAAERTLGRKVPTVPRETLEAVERTTFQTFERFEKNASPQIEEAPHELESFLSTQGQMPLMQWVVSFLGDLTESEGEEPPLAEISTAMLAAKIVLDALAATVDADGPSLERN